MVFVLYGMGLTESCCSDLRKLTSRHHNISKRLSGVGECGAARLLWVLSRNITCRPIVDKFYYC